MSMGKSLNELISGYVCRCEQCEQAGRFELIGLDLDATLVSQRFEELYGNFVLSKIDEELKQQGLLPKSDWSELQVLDYQARIVTRYGEIKQYVLNQGIKQFALTFEDNKETIVCRCPDCDSELIRITLKNQS